MPRANAEGIPIIKLLLFFQFQKILLHLHAIGVAGELAGAAHHPVAGDPVYGPHNCITSLHGQCLHAKTLGFIHPITGEQLRFDSELPEYFTHFLATLRRGTL